MTVARCGVLSRAGRIAESAEAYKVVLAVAHLAKSLDLRVIAEHVETPEVLERLRTTGIECGQGFLFDAPEEFLTGAAIAEMPLDTFCGVSGGPCSSTRASCSIY